MEMKQKSCHGIYSNLLSYLLDKKILKSFNDFQNQIFSVLWLKWIELMEIKQNQTFLIGAYSNLTLFITGCKKLKYLNDFYHFNSIAKVSTNKPNEIKSNGTCADLRAFFLIYKILRNFNDFWNLFLDKIHLKNE